MAPLSYGDAVVLVHRTQDGTITRTNATVLASRSCVPTTLDRQPVKDAAPEQHLDVAFPVLSLAPNGQPLKTRSIEDIFRLAYDVGPWAEGNWIGFEVPAAPAVEAPVDGQIVPLAHLVDLATQVANIDPTLSLSPDAVVSSATDALAGAKTAFEALAAKAKDELEYAVAAASEKISELKAELEHLRNQKPAVDIPEKNLAAFVQASSDLLNESKVEPGDHQGTHQTATEE